MNIHYRSDTSREYSAGLARVETLAELRLFLKEYRTLCRDAVKAIPANEEEFVQFRAGQKIEARGKFAGEEFADRYGAIILPEIMLNVSLIAERFRVPWGCAFLRCKDEGLVVCWRDGYRWKGVEE